MIGTPLDPTLARLIDIQPALGRRVEAMYYGCVRKGTTTPERAAEWVLTTLRRESEARAAEGGSKPVQYLNDRQYARDMRARENNGARRDREYLDALATIGAIDRVRLEARP